MILVTCAGGKTGRAIAAGLAAEGTPVRAMVRRESSMASLDSLGLADICAGDLANPDDVARAADGVTAIYYIAPNMNPDERRIGNNMIDAAKKQGSVRFVFHSVLHPQLEAASHPPHAGASQPPQAGASQQVL